MINPISVQAHVRSLEIPSLNPIAPPAINPGESPLAENSFSATLADSLNKVNAQMVESDKKAEDLASGQSNDVHGTLIAMEKADLSFRTVLEVRSRALRAYDEVMRISI